MGTSASSAPPTVASHWDINVESLRGDGSRVIRSEPIKEYEFDELWEAYMRLLNERPPMPHEASYEVREMEDGALLTTTGFDASILLGGSGTVYRYMLNYVDKEKHEVVCNVFGTDKDLKDSSKESSSTLRFFKDPFQIEYFAEEHATRKTGPVQVGIMDLVLGMLGTTARGHADADSPSGGGLKCVLSDPITDVSHTAESVLAWSFKVCQDFSGGIEQPDGSILEEKFFWGPMVTSYKRFVMDHDNCQVITYDYGLDATQTNPSEVSFLKAHENPLRLEFYVITQDRLIADYTAKGVVELFISTLLPHVKR